MSQETGRKLRWGVMGAARINRRLIPGLKQASNAELIGIASRDQAKAEEAARNYGAPRIYTSYEALLDDPEIEVVYIPLPNSLHVEWAIKAAAAGKHALVEKPLALDPGDLTELEQVAKQAGVLVMEAFMYRFHPQQARVKELIASGAIGEVQVVKATQAFVLGSDGYNIRLDEEVGGGATWDVGCYSVNVARYIFEAEPQAVYAEGSSRPGAQVDTSVAAILDFSEGRRAVLDYSIDYGRRSTYEVIGTKGTLAVENMWQEPDKPAYIYHRDDQGLHTEELPPVNHFQLEVEAFSRAILEKQPAPYSLEDARLNTLACRAILQSIKEGRRIEIE
jgi:predicted dehydrogenase